MSSLIKTRVLILSDTHGLRFEEDKKPLAPADLAIHCGDLTEDSKLESFRETIRLLKEIDAPTKIVIAGNHDFSLDDGVFKDKIAEASRVAQEDLTQSIKDEYGDYGEAKRLFTGADPSIIFLDEGTHEIHLQNGAFIKLFSAIAKAQPRIHCFGHVHGSWGAKIVSWRPQISENPSHFSDIDNAKSRIVESLPRLQGTKWESPEDSKARENKLQLYGSQRCCIASYCQGDEERLPPGKTFFVNAALMGDKGLSQYPWLVDIELERHSGEGNSSSGNATPEKGHNIQKGKAAVASSEDGESKKAKLDLDDDSKR
ncbi:metallophosphoesterase domain-containing protein [Fusarium phyllophilum]|uniref:Metallophosphoesterase domain-containing protein n=1 Tax=Fusarium phyllophilum TaxID=47803 RepID=A0A8H5JRV1_9HYPO|nr:metallophosphoesterase domain-containing protein [Fusarium phyllophilum]